MYYLNGKIQGGRKGKRGSKSQKHDGRLLQVAILYPIIESCHQNIIGVNLTHVAKQGVDKMVQF